MNTLYIAQSLDGFIARIDGSIDWLPQEMDEQFNDFYQNFYATLDIVILGRKTYDQIVTVLSPEQWPYQGKKTYVLTSRPLANTSEIEFVSDFSFLETIKNKKTWIVGGTSVSNYFIENDLVDEYIISTIPVILGEGIPLFPNISKDIVLEVQDVITSSLGTQVTYIKK